MKTFNSYLKGICYLLCVILIFSFIACNKDSNTTSKPVGFLSLGIEVSLQVNELSNRLKAADQAEFLIIIRAEDGSEVLRFDRFADMPASIDLEEGTYYVEANSNNMAPAGFETDYYEGVTELFTITAGQISSVTVPCSLANVMITVVYTQNTLDNFDDYQTTVTSANGSLSFLRGETRAGYFEVRPLSIEATLEYTQGGSTQSINLVGNIASPEAGRNYEIVIDAALNSADVIISLDVDESVETEIITLTNADVEAVSPQVGDLIVSEIIFNPDATTDAQGEWFEIYNTTGSPIQLSNLILSRLPDGGTHTITDDLVLAPNSYFVVAKTATATTAADYISSWVSLPNSGDDTLVLSYDDGSGEIEISRVNYNGVDFVVPPAGASMQLNPNNLNASDVNVGASWCASSAIFDTGDLGTPGISNSACQ